MVDRKAAFVQQGIALIELGRAQAGHRGRHAKKIVRNLADHQIGLVGSCAGNEHVGIAGARFLQDRRLYAVAHHSPKIKPLLKQPQAGRILVDDSDVVVLGAQALGDTLADSARAQDDDVHGIKIIPLGLFAAPVTFKGRAE
jgi:hypothetical protein